LLPQRAREKDIQNEILSNLTEKSPQFSDCLKSNQLFKKFNTKRIKLVIFLTIDSKGHIEKFNLDEKKYPNLFSECIFNVVSTISFPKIKNHELIELQQPFIFSLK
jgi:hypothetical protein